MKEAVPGPISGCEDRLGEGDSFGGGCRCGPSTARVRAAVGPSQPRSLPRKAVPGRGTDV